MVHIILYSIVPILVIMLLGYYSGKTGAFSGDNARVLNKVVLNYALPAALFLSIVKANREMLAVDLKLTLISCVVLIGCFMLVYLVYRYMYRDTMQESAISALISGSPTIGFLGFSADLRRLRFRRAGNSNSRDRSQRNRNSARSRSLQHGGGACPGESRGRNRPDRKEAQSLGSGRKGSDGAGGMGSDPCRDSRALRSQMAVVS